MARAIWTELKAKKIAAMTTDERKEYERGYAEAHQAADVDERVEEPLPSGERLNG